MDDSPTGSICFVTTDLVPLTDNGEAGTYFCLMPQLLARHGFRVHLLCADHDLEHLAAGRAERRRLAMAGIGFSALPDFPAPPHFDLPTHGSNPLLQRSERVCHVLQQLHAHHCFDVIEFADRGATGFSTVQARRTGLAFGDVRLLVKLHGSSQWRREARHQWPTSKEDLRIDFAERFAFDHADLQASSCQALLDYARGSGWKVRDEVRVIRSPCLEPTSPPSAEAGQNPELVNREVVEEYRQLVSKQGLLVAAGPVVARSPDHPVVARSPDRATEADRRSPGSWRPAVWENGTARRPCHNEGNGLVNSSPTLVSVVVTHYNLGAYLPEALAALAAQTYAHLDVIVIDDGSTDSRAQQVWQEQKQLYPHYRFIGQDNGGPGAARNRGLAEARGKYVIFLDADNVACPELVASFVRGLERNPEVAALTCHVLGFRQERVSQQRHWVFRNAFPGGPHILACVENVYGDTTAIFRTADLRAAGGYETDRSTPWEDWLTYIRLVHAGYQVEVVPACLLLYRVRADGRTARLNKGRHDEDRHTQHLVRKYFSGPLLPPGVDAASLWPVLLGFARLGEQHATLRHRLVERFNSRLRNIPWLHRGLKTMLSMLAWLPRLLT